MEPSITAIIGKNESGKTNVLDGLAQIDFVANKSSAYAQDKLNRTSSSDSQIQYIVTIKPAPEDIANGITDDTLVVLSKNNYELTGGMVAYYNTNVKNYVDTLVSAIEALGIYPFNLQNQELTNFNGLISALKATDVLNLPQIYEALTFLYKKQGTVPAEQKTSYVEALTVAIDKIKQFGSSIPHFFYRNSDKHLQTTYKYDDVENELKNPSANSNSLLHNLVSLIGISIDEFVIAAKAGTTPQQASYRKKINKLINEKINTPFQDFYKTEKIYLGIDFNSNIVSFTVQSEDGEALMLSERSNGLRWYLETFIEASYHNVFGKKAVYLFDEPGASLHVNAQKELIRLFHHLADNGNQVVYTTHSPYMLETEHDGIIRIRAVVKDADGYSKIYKTAYDSRIAPNSQQDTLAPLINAIGMNLSDTFGPAKDKINIVAEGMSDYIYICLMAQILKLDTDKYSIIPSVGASNCVNICSILHGWGCKYIAVLDYDKAGVESGGEILRKKMCLKMGEHFCYLADVEQSDIEAKTYKDEKSKCMIEDLITREEIDRFCSETNTSRDECGKVLIAKLMTNAVKRKTYTLGNMCIENFKSLFDRIFKAIPELEY